jgi:hypothetical protein
VLSRCDILSHIMLVVLQLMDLDLVSDWMGGINFSPLDLSSSGSQITAAQDGVASVQLAIAHQKLTVDLAGSNLLRSARRQTLHRPGQAQ